MTLLLKALEALRMKQLSHERNSFLSEYDPGWFGNALKLPQSIVRMCLNENYFNLIAYSRWEQNQNNHFVMNEGSFLMGRSN